MKYTFAGLEGAYRDASREIETLAAEVGVERLTWRPRAGAWSVAECLDHLGQTALLYLPRLEKALGRARGGSAESGRRFRYGFVARQFILRMEPPARLRLPAPAALRPLPGSEPAAVLERLRGTRRRWEALFARAAPRRWHAVRVGHPQFSPLRLPLGDWLGMLAAHDRRHLWQARRVTESGGFPPAGGARGRPVVL